MSDVSMCNQLLVAHLCCPMSFLGLLLVVRLAGVQQKIQAKSGGVSSHNTSSNAAEPFHVLHMDPISDVSMCNQLLVAHLCLPMLCFGLRLGTVWQVCSKSKPKLMVFPAKMPHQNDAEPFHVLHMDPMSDVSMCNQFLVAHLC
jgi:hypothetical protein